MIGLEKDVWMGRICTMGQGKKLIKNREKKSLDQKQKSGENQKNRKQERKKEEVSTWKARMTEIDPAQTFLVVKPRDDAQKLFNVKWMPQPR